MDSKEFDKHLETDKLIVIDFFATWCGPCQMMHPTIEELKEKYKDDDKVEVLTIDIDENPAIPASYGIMSVPTFLFIKNKEAVDRIIGSTTKDIIDEKIKLLTQEEKKK